MNNNRQSNLYSSANSSTSTLRPRNPRLISYIDSESNGIDTTATTVSTSNSTTSTATPSSNPWSRSVVSPAAKPSKHSQTSDPFDTGERRPSNGLWESWSQIQGLASTILRNDGSASATSTKSAKLKSPTWTKQDRPYSIAQSMPSWGPKTANTNARPSVLEDRQAQVQARKRQALLQSACESTKDTSGRFKRKGSDASLTVHSPTSDPASDTLVYRHKVIPSDTLAGVAIKYSCQAEAFRKVNRFWANDNIQTRREVFVPVAACTIRGRKVNGPGDNDLLGEEVDDLKTKSQSTFYVSNSNDKSPTLNSGSAPDFENDGSYRHDSWMQLPSFAGPTEILRIPQRTLGYFPPARRKSVTRLVPDSIASSPRTSFDTLRHPPSHAAQQRQQQQSIPASLDASPVRRPRLSSPSQRQRSSSTGIAGNPNSVQSQFMLALRGPGGVGSLSGLRTEIARPGPAEDPLNQRFVKYLPEVARTLADPTTEFLAPPGPISGVLGGRTFSSLALPRASIDSVRSSRSARSNSSSSAVLKGAGVEGWMKNLNLGKGRPSTSRTNSHQPHGRDLVGGETGFGDLIELEGSVDTIPSLDVGAGDAFSSSLRGKAKEAGAGSNTTTGRTSRSGSGPPSSAETDLLNERFPVRGRITKAYGQD